MKNKIKLLSLDLDGTTLTSQNTLSDKVKSAIEKAIENDIEIVVASGRPYGTMPDDILKIDGINYVIASNGARIYDSNGICVHSSLLNGDDVIRILDATKPYDLIFEAFIKGLTYTDKRYADKPADFGCSEAYIEYVQSAHGRIEDMRAFIYEHRFELDSVEFIQHDETLLRKLWNEIADSTNGLYITSSTPTFVEFMNCNATKANALKWICKNIGIAQNEVSACGNADNDADMVSFAGLGTAVENATELCKSCADLIVRSNDENGVAQLIEIILGE